jgi:hypothetical protein
MVKSCLKRTILLTMIFAPPILLIRALPYDDRAIHVVSQQNCSAPCFMGIRPGTTTMEGAVHILAAHDWVASSTDDFPALVREAIFFGAAVPRTIIDWRWSEGVPEWIDGTQDGAMLVENREVLDLIIQTRLSLGEIILALGNPDASWFVASNTSSGRRFEYSAWYASDGMLVTTEAWCPMQHYYYLPVRIIFRSDSPGPIEAVPQESVCR